MFVMTNGDNRLGVPLAQSGCKILWSLLISLEGINWYHRIFALRYWSSMRDYHFWLNGASCVTGSIGFQGSLIINIPGRNQLIPCQTTVILSFFFIYSLASFLKLTGGPFSYGLFCNLYWILFSIILICCFTRSPITNVYFCWVC